MEITFYSQWNKVIVTEYCEKDIVTNKVSKILCYYNILRFLEQLLVSSLSLGFSSHFYTF